MRSMFALVVLVLSAIAGSASAGPFDTLNKAAQGVKSVAASPAAAKEVEHQVNAKLTIEARKNQCSFKSDTDVIVGNCGTKMKKLANELINAKRRLSAVGVTSFKFEVSGHTDSSGAADHNKELSNKRAAVIARELAARGVPADDIVSIGMGSERMLVSPDNTPAKKAKNRRYEIQVRL